MVRWMSQYWYIPTRLGDECMLSLLVIGRSSMMYKYLFFLKNIFCRSCLQSRGAWTAQFSKSRMDRLVHFGIHKGGAHLEISAGTQGEYGQQKVYQRREYLGPPFALDVKGGEWLGVVVACGGCHQVQRGRLLALWFKGCPWWQLTQRLVQVLRGWYKWWQLNQRTDLSTAWQESLYTLVGFIKSACTR